ncbi:hypothetical protein MWU38_00385 [Qipengyuania sp. S6317L1]|uniref:hypothetical protein n=1 Tax=Qipengyuania sp. S6317L1 TaxID=2926410 RepID=UPI001FF11A18|nr:hypothetical protein [Qipengyuania sp. S6317L1]MCK0097826.1 hypothetical protein [Qipengyuania sp. S6317L1]
MSEELDSNEIWLSDRAFSIMKTWQWVRYDPDGVPSASPTYLSDVLNRLAFEGMEAPKSALLAMLQRGQLTAHGDFRWSKYERGDFFDLEGCMSAIPPERWKTLSDLLREEKRQLEEGEFRGPKTTLQKMGMNDVPIVDWEPNLSRFSFALCPPGTSSNDPEYFEECYSVQDITIFPLALPGPDGEIVGVANQAMESQIEEAASERATRGRRPKYDWPESVLAVFGFIHRGELRPETQADIERALIAYLSGEEGGPSESTVRPYAKLIWTESQKA